MFPQLLKVKAKDGTTVPTSGLEVILHPHVGRNRTQDPDPMTRFKVGLEIVSNLIKSISILTRNPKAQECYHSTFDADLSK